MSQEGIVMRSWALLLAGFLVGFLAASSPLAAFQDSTNFQDSTREEPPPEVGIQHHQGEGYRRLQAVVPGRILSVRAHQRPDGGSYLLILLAPENGDSETPRALYQLDPSGEGELVELSRNLPRATTSLQRLSRGSLEGPVFLDGPTGISYLEIRDGEAVLRAASGAPVNTSGTPARKALAGSPGAPRLLPMVAVGKLSLFRLQENGDLHRTRELAIPVTAKRQARSLLLTSPPVTEMPRTGEEFPLFLVGPEPQGDRRLRTLFLDPANNDGESQVVEAWSRLPGPEEVDQSWYAWLDDRPVLLVTTLRSDKLGLFEKQKLRLFRLAPDRTRAGLRPTLEVLTASRRWFQIEPQILDITGDGRDDLVVIQPEGLGGGELLVEAFVGLGGGLFRQTSRRSVIGTRATTWRFGKDLNGDGAADLVVLAEGRISIFAGTPNHQRRVVERKAWKTLPLESSSTKLSVDISVGVSDGESQSEVSRSTTGRMRLQDLDGDGRSEILFTQKSPQGRGVLQLYRLDE